MRAPRVILVMIVVVLAVVGALLCFGPIGAASPYRRFHSRDQAYYAQLAYACDSVLQQHTGFTRHSEASGTPLAMCWMDANDVVWDQIRLSPDDASLPDEIRALHADEVLLAPKRVFIGFGAGRLAWSIIWEQVPTQTNTWTLQSNADGLVKNVYSAVNHTILSAPQPSP